MLSYIVDSLAKITLNVTETIGLNLKYRSFCDGSVMYTKAYPESLPFSPVRRAIYTGRERGFPFKPVERMRKGIP